MKKLLYGCVFLAIFAWGGTARASFYSESLIYTGPPEFEEVYDFGNSPTYASGSAYRKDAEAQARWWELGVRLNNTWDSTYQGWIYVYAAFDKDFKVTAAGPASMGFSWDGILQASGDPKYDNYWELWAAAWIQDITLGRNAEIDWYDEISAVGTLPPSERATFNYLFAEKDVGAIFTISLVLQTEITHPLGETRIDFTGSDSLEFNSNFYNTLKIDNISGGIEAIEGTPIPIPSAIWLLGTGVICILGIRKKLKN